MNADGHLSKARAIKNTVEGIIGSTDDLERDTPAIVELIYGVAQHAIAYGTEIRHGRHRDSHVGLPKLLRELNEDDIADEFETLDMYRQGRWYGGKWDGDVVADCQAVLADIERWAGL